LASGTGPRSAASEIVVANVISPERSITAASAVGPSSQGVENTKWSLASRHRPDARLIADEVHAILAPRVSVALRVVLD
jgi:hypothetical protein